MCKDLCSGRGTDCRGEQVFSRQSKIKVMGWRSNVKLEKIFCKNRVHDKRSWFTLK